MTAPTLASANGRTVASPSTSDAASGGSSSMDFDLGGLGASAGDEGGPATETPLPERASGDDDGLDFDLVCVVGLQEGEWPSPLSEDPILPDVDRRVLSEALSEPQALREVEAEGVHQEDADHADVGDDDPALIVEALGVVAPPALDALTEVAAAAAALRRKLSVQHSYAVRRPGKGLGEADRRGARFAALRGARERSDGVYAPSRPTVSSSRRPFRTTCRRHPTRPRAQR